MEYSNREGERFGGIAIAGTGVACPASQTNLNGAIIRIEAQIFIGSEFRSLRDLGNIPEKCSPVRSLTANKAVFSGQQQFLRAQTPEGRSFRTELSSSKLPSNSPSNVSGLVTLRSRSVELADLRQPSP